MKPFDPHLEKVKDLQMAFKSDAVRKFACLVVDLAIGQKEFWPDQIDVDQLAEADRNCIGSVYRWLCNVGILVRTEHFRRSEADGAKGRTIFQYRLADDKLARVFQTRNSVVHVEHQPELL